MDLDLKELTNNYLKNYIVYLLIFLIFTIVGIYSVSKINNKYVINIGLMIGSNNINNYIYKCSKLIKTDIVIEDIKKTINLDYSNKEIEKNIQVKYDEKSDYIKIKLIFKDKKLLVNITDELINSLKKYLKELYDENNIYLVNKSEIKVVNNKNLYKIIIFIISLVISFIISIINYLHKQINKYTLTESSYKAPIIRKIE